MKWLFLVVLILGFISVGSAQIITTDISEMNHGGWGSVINVGADKGDILTLDITCDHTDPSNKGMCFYGTPIVQTCSSFPNVKCNTPIKFGLVSSTFGHQLYRASAPATGDQFIETQYWWVGTQVHYYLHITNLEVIQF